MPRKKSTDNQISAFDNYVAKEKPVKESAVINITSGNQEITIKTKSSDKTTSKKEKSFNGTENVIKTKDGKEHKYLYTKSFKTKDEKPGGWDHFYEDGVIIRDLNPHGQYSKKMKELESGVHLTNFGVVKKHKNGNVKKLTEVERAKRIGFKHAMIEQAKYYNLIQKAKAEAEKNKKK